MLLGKLSRRVALAQLGLLPPSALEGAAPQLIGFAGTGRATSGGASSRAPE
jgi:hypothetical protein